MNDELPDSWIRSSFSSVVVDPIQRVPSEKETITYIDIGSVDRDTKTITEPQSMLGKDAPSRARKVIHTGDVLVSTVRPNLNAVAMVDSKYDGQFASTGFDVLRSPVVDPRWLFYSVRTPGFLDRMSELVQGALYPAVRSKDIRSFVIPIAPLAEQKRIADKLEAVLGRVDACRARLDRVPALLKRFRQSVLTAATSGRLTEEWRMTNGVSDEWENTDLLSICSSISDGDHLPPPQTTTGIPFLTIGNISSGKLDFTNARYVPESYFDNIRATRVPKPGDTLYSVVGASIGIAVMVDVNRKFCFQRHIAILKPSEGTSPGFLQLLMNSPEVFREAWSRTTGTAQPTLPLGALRTIPVGVPTLPEQQEIVRRVEALFAMADRIEARLAAAQKTVERLTPATLAKAFRGELVPQDPNDEPASALLGRLPGQPVAKPAKGRRTKRATRQKS
jgi:type I restriction enzyme S subunit